jgi:hypothetical protein
VNLRLRDAERAAWSWRRVTMVSTRYARETAARRALAAAIFIHAETQRCLGAVAKQCSNILGALPVLVSPRSCPLQGSPRLRNPTDITMSRILGGTRSLAGIRAGTSGVMTPSSRAANKWKRRPRARYLSRGRRYLSIAACTNDGQKWGSMPLEATSPKLLGKLFPESVEEG